MLFLKTHNLKYMSIKDQEVVFKRFQRDTTARD